MPCPSCDIRRANKVDFLVPEESMNIVQFPVPNTPTQAKINAEFLQVYILTRFHTYTWLTFFPERNEHTCMIKFDFPMPRRPKKVPVYSR